jgi:5-methylcytosine-specific restriction protein A
MRNMCAGRCGRVLPRAGRCPDCKRAKQRKQDRARGTAWQRGYNSEYQKNRGSLINDDSYCYNCGHTGDKDNPLTGDHIKPRHLEIDNSIENLGILCRSCNSSKGGKV